jgi:DNA-directed RNA polymerase subunit RPC12/RpoP
MEEQRANLGPKYAIRLADLRGWHIITAVCSACRRRAQMRLWELTARHPGHTHLIDVERRLRCRHCGNREGNSVYVTIADRE